eukprot:Rhum_TRINITY_DN14394_c0_g1::Rhum_TRINITY_DN14394_c0_g1_i1::g.86036::m.86036/K11251/H2A; histone H2A
MTASKRSPTKKSPSKKSKKARSTLSEKAQLQFPVARIGSALKKGRYATRVSGTGAVFLTAVLQYCTSELLSLSAKAAETSHKKGGKKAHQIKPRHICAAVREDDDLSTLLRDVAIAGGGVQQGVHTAIAKTAGTGKSKPSKKGSKSDKKKKDKKRGDKKRGDKKSKKSKKDKASKKA